MQIPQELTAARQAEQRLMEIAEERQRLMDIATRAGVDTTRDRVQRSPGDRTGTGAASLADLLTDLERQAAQYSQHIHETAERIAGIDSARHRELLHRRYIQGQSWRTIMREMGYSHKQNMFRAHKEAIRKYPDDDQMMTK